MASATTYPIEPIAKLLDLTPRRVQQLAGEGVLPKAERGRYDLVGCVRGYIKYLRERALPADVADDGLRQHRTRRFAADADVAEIKAAQLRRELLPVAEVDREWASMMTKVRSGMLTVPSKVRGRLPHLTNEEVAEVEFVIRDILTDLSRENHAILEASSGSPAAGDDAPEASAEDAAVGVD